MVLSMRISRTGSAIVLLLFIVGCASKQPLDRYASNVVFTVPYAQSGNQLASGFTQQTPVDSPAAQNLIQAVLRFHGLTKVSQFTIEALNVEAVVAGFGPSRNLDDVVSDLSEDKRVQSVQSVKPYTLMSYNDPYFALQSTVNGDQIDSIHQISTGKNVVVGIVDTGVDRWHPELINNIVYTKNLVDSDQDSFDNDEHGTAVAGVIASAANNDLGIVGVAPDVQLMVFKACHQEKTSRRTSCDSLSIIKALSDVLVQQPDILNLSLSGPRDAIIERLLREVYRNGIVVLGAVDESRGLAESFPANMEEVIAVGTAINIGGGFTDVLLAPGTDMLTTAPGATYGFKSGSSMATAYVSGIVALMKEHNPALSNAEVYGDLRASARFDENDLPVIDMCRAVNTTIESAHECERIPSMAGSGQGITSSFQLAN
jgi:subtilisin family serine protease